MSFHLFTFVTTTTGCFIGGSLARLFSLVVWSLVPGRFFFFVVDGGVVLAQLFVGAACACCEGVWSALLVASCR